MLTREADLQTIQNSQSKWEWPQLTLNKHLSEPILPHIIILQAWEELKIWPLFLSKPISMRDQGAQMNQRRMSVRHHPQSFDKDSIDQV